MPLVMNCSWRLPPTLLTGTTKATPVPGISICMIVSSPFFTAFHTVSVTTAHRTAFCVASRLK